MDEKTITLAALLHDVGMLCSIKQEDHDPVELSVEFINEMKMDKRMNETILHHHDPVSELEFFGKILRKSDRDSGEEEKEALW